MLPLKVIWLCLDICVHVCVNNISASEVQWPGTDWNPLGVCLLDVPPTASPQPSLPAGTDTGAQTLSAANQDQGLHRSLSRDQPRRAERKQLFAVFISFFKLALVF